MSRTFALVLSFCLPLLFLASPATAKDCFSKPADDCPSKAAQKLPGALGKKGFTAIQLGLKKEIHGTTYWYDTDGVDPAVAGCHIGVTDGSDKKQKNGHTFGEAYISDVVLIESNPGSLDCPPS